MYIQRNVHHDFESGAVEAEEGAGRGGSRGVAVATGDIGHPPHDDDTRGRNVPSRDGLSMGIHTNRRHRESAMGRHGLARLSGRASRRRQVASQLHLARNTGSGGYDMPPAAPGPSRHWDPMDDNHDDAGRLASLPRMLTGKRRGAISREDAFGVSAEAATRTSTSDEPGASRRQLPPSDNPTTAARLDMRQVRVTGHQQSSCGRRHRAARTGKSAPAKTAGLFVLPAPPGQSRREQTGRARQRTSPRPRWHRASREETVADGEATRREAAMSNDSEHPARLATAGVHIGKGSARSQAESEAALAASLQYRSPTYPELGSARDMAAYTPADMACHIVERIMHRIYHDDRACGPTIVRVTARDLRGVEAAPRTETVQRFQDDANPHIDHVRSRGTSAGGDAAVTEGRDELDSAAHADGAPARDRAPSIVLDSRCEDTGTYSQGDGTVGSPATISIRAGSPSRPSPGPGPVPVGATLKCDSDGAVDEALHVRAQLELLSPLLDSELDALYQLSKQKSPIFGADGALRDPLSGGTRACERREHAGGAADDSEVAPSAAPDSSGDIMAPATRSTKIGVSAHTESMELLLDRAYMAMLPDGSSVSRAGDAAVVRPPVAAPAFPYNILRTGCPVPDSLIPERFFLYETSPVYEQLKARDSHAGTAFPRVSTRERSVDLHSRLWHQQVFPSKKPAASTREEALYLAQTLDAMLHAVRPKDSDSHHDPAVGLGNDDSASESGGLGSGKRIQETTPRASDHMKAYNDHDINGESGLWMQSGDFRALPPPVCDVPYAFFPKGHVPESVDGVEVFGLPPRVIAEISVWSVTLAELVRQEFVHCEERGVLLERARIRLLQLLGWADAWSREQARSRVALEIGLERSNLSWQTKCAEQAERNARAIANMEEALAHAEAKYERLHEAWAALRDQVSTLDRLHKRAHRSVGVGDNVVKCDSVDRGVQKAFPAVLVTKCSDSGSSGSAAGDSADAALQTWETTRRTGAPRLMRLSAPLSRVLSKAERAGVTVSTGGDSDDESDRVRAADDLGADLVAVEEDSDGGSSHSSDALERSVVVSRSRIDHNKRRSRGPQEPEESFARTTHDSVVGQPVTSLSPGHYTNVTVDAIGIIVEAERVTRRSSSDGLQEDTNGVVAPRHQQVPKDNIDRSTSHRSTQTDLSREVKHSETACSSDAATADGSGIHLGISIADSPTSSDVPGLLSPPSERNGAPSGTRGEAMHDSTESSRMQRLRGRRLWSVPPAWDSLLRSARAVAKPLPQRQLRQTMLQIYLAKSTADRSSRVSDSPVDEMPRFVIHHFVRTFGTRSLVQSRLASLLLSLKRYRRTDPVAHLFARFCGLVQRLPTVPLTLALEALWLAFRGTLPPVHLDSPYRDKPMLCCSRKHALEAVRIVARKIPNAPTRSSERHILDLPGWIPVESGAASPTASGSPQGRRTNGKGSGIDDTTSDRSRPHNPARPVTVDDLTKRCIAATGSDVLVSAAYSTVARSKLRDCRIISGLLQDNGSEPSSMKGRATSIPVEASAAVRRGCEMAARHAHSGGGAHEVAAISAVFAASFSLGEVDGDGRPLRTRSLRCLSAAAEGARAGAAAAAKGSSNNIIAEKAATAAVAVASVRDGELENVAARRICALFKAGRVESGILRHRAARFEATREKIDATEVISTVVQMWESAQSAAKAKLRRLFIQFDVDNSGVLDLDEWLALMRHLERGAKRHASGYETAQRSAPNRISEEEATKLYVEAMETVNGPLRVDAFLEWAASEPRILFYSS